MVDADAIEKRVYELVQPWNGRSWLTFKMPHLNGETSLNHTMNMDEEEAQDLLDEIFTEFNLIHSDLNFSVYFPFKNRKDAKPLTINMLIESAKAGRWLYD
ncbi:MAG: acyl carrier protein [Proteobacteria bacterium]|nr:acyl carrier protein [Pseudomonadota bacterium]